MSIFDYLERYNYEQVVFCQDRDAGLRAVIAIHDTTLGPALGGTRMWTYATEEDAIEDALRLARGMTYKAAIAGLQVGGGKGVIIGDPKKDKSEALFRAYGRYIQSLNGRYITAEDVGTTEEDMDHILMETRYVTGVSPVFGSGGTPSPMTGYGVYKGMKAAAKFAFGDDSLRDRVIAVQGAGSVAYALCQYLHQEGAHIIVTDIYQPHVDRMIENWGVEAVPPDHIYDVDCDIFSPNALGAVVNDQTIDRLKCKVIAGAANNQLQDEIHGEILMKKGIFYAPDYVINAGGLIHVADELYGYNRTRVMQKIERIYDNISRVFQIAEQEQIPSSIAADRLAEQRIQALGRVKSTYLQQERSVLSFDRR
ncbi:leucine dehydrogenase [Seinonella peptonophila]|uniref:Leucine dehydrogenase n=1 Tax=Seinonella peptonophila TaxID=112248 RepID=A0A1M4TLP1_9BACL|nr:amino acid dehydrogenase [Seinonella peptonophila]SHE45207.1 leucine dehydrogenase [Seinonella peptonophila]